MAFDLSKMTAATREISVEFGGQKLVMAYKFAQVSSVTLAEEGASQVKAQMLREKNVRNLSRALTDAAKVYDEAATPETLTAATVALDAATQALMDYQQGVTAENVLSWAEKLPERLQSWDMTNGDGSLFPLEADAIAKGLPYDLLTKIWERISEAGNTVDPPKPAS